jgi:hypothetical protein
LPTHPKVLTKCLTVALSIAHIIIIQLSLIAAPTATTAQQEPHQSGVIQIEGTLSSSHTVLCIINFAFDEWNHPVIPASCTDSSCNTITLNFVVDTGFSNSVVFASSAERLGLKVLPVPQEGRHSVGKSLSPDYTVISDMRIRGVSASIHLANAPIRVLQDQSVNAPHIDGVIGCDILSAFPFLEIDFDRQQMTFIASTNRSQANIINSVNMGNVKPTQLFKNALGRYACSCLISVDGKAETRRLVLDTGSECSLLTADELHQSSYRGIFAGNVDFAAAPANANLISIGPTKVNESMHAYAMASSDIERAVRASKSSNANVLREPILGLIDLMRFRLLIDFPHRKLYVEVAKPVVTKIPSEFRAGVVSVPISMGGKYLGQFVLDSTTAGCLMRRSLAGNIDIFSALSKDTIIPNTTTVGNMTLPRTTVGVVDDAVFDGHFPGYAGVIGFNLMAMITPIIDYKHSAVILVAHGAIDDGLKNRLGISRLSRIPISQHEVRGAYWIHAKLEGNSRSVVDDLLVSSTSRSSSISHEDATTLDLHPTGPTLNVPEPGGSHVSLDPSIVSIFNCGDFLLRNLDVYYPNASISASVVPSRIGSKFFRSTFDTVVLDFRDNAIYGILAHKRN